MSSSVRKKLPAVAAGLLILSFAAANLLLVRQNLQLRAELSRYQPDELRIVGTNGGSEQGTPSVNCRCTPTRPARLSRQRSRRAPDPSAQSIAEVERTMPASRASAMPHLTRSLRPKSSALIMRAFMPRRLETAGGGTAEGVKRWLSPISDQYEWGPVKRVRERACLPTLEQRCVLLCDINDLRVRGGGV